MDDMDTLHDDPEEEAAWSRLMEEHDPDDQAEAQQPVASSGSPRLLEVPDLASKVKELISPGAEGDRKEVRCLTCVLFLDEVGWMCACACVCVGAMMTTLG